MIKRCFVVFGLIASLFFCGCSTITSYYFDKYFEQYYTTDATDSAEEVVFNNVVVRRNVPVEMRDGIVLYMDIYTPGLKGKQKFPTILVRQPYGKIDPYTKMEFTAEIFTRAGYVFAVQDMRGRFVSQGVFDPFVNERNDGYDTIDWLSKQRWSDGNIGMFGLSYFGYATWAAALSGHPNLKAIAPAVTSMDIYGVWVYNNGAFCLQTMGFWSILMHSNTYQNTMDLDSLHLPLATLPYKGGIPSPIYSDWIDHPTRDSFWETINLHRYYEQITIPAFHLGGWYDVFLKSTIDDWIGVRRHSRSETAKAHQYLYIGPFDHEFRQLDTHNIGQIDIGKDHLEFIDDLVRFFDCYVKGEPNGFDKSPPVKFFVIGDNKWRMENQWPPAGMTYQELYFHSKGEANTKDGDGKLDKEKPGDQPADKYIYDPADPVSISSKIDLWKLGEQLKDRSSIENRSDVLVYTSDPLERDMEITGPISVVLYAESSAVDTDFTATLVNAFPSGYAHTIQEGIVRASYRTSDTRPEPIVPGQIYQYEIDLWASSHVVKKGHRLRVEISSSNFDRWDRNLNTGERFGYGKEMIKAHQTVHHSKLYPSHIRLPVVTR